MTLQQLAEQYLELYDSRLEEDRQCTGWHQLKDLVMEVKEELIDSDLVVFHSIRFNLTHMTHSEKLEYMRLALAICGYGFPAKDLDLFVSLYDKIIESSGEVGLREVVMIESEVKARHEVPTEILLTQE